MKKPIDVKVTAEGFEKLKQEEQELILRRPGVLARMVAAREQGDLSENAGFHAAKEELGRIDRRLRELRLMIRFADIIAVKESSVVALGNSVVIADGSEEKEFKIIGKLEADPVKCVVSDQSPVGSALLGKKVGDSVSIDVPDGKIVYKIIGIK